MLARGRGFFQESTPLPEGTGDAYRDRFITAVNQINAKKREILEAKKDLLVPENFETFVRAVFTFDPAQLPTQKGIDELSSTVTTTQDRANSKNHLKLSSLYFALAEYCYYLSCKEDFLIKNLLDEHPETSSLIELISQKIVSMGIFAQAQEYYKLAYAHLQIAKKIHQANPETELSSELSQKKLYDGISTCADAIRSVLKRDFDDSPSFDDFVTSKVDELTARYLPTYHDDGRVIRAALG